MSFETIEIDSVIIDRENRQRKEVKGLYLLQESIKQNGIISPIVIDKDNKLIAGERRLRAARSMGWTAIPAHRLEDLDEFQAQVIELEENVRRSELHWKDRACAMAKYHQARAADNADWTMADTARVLLTSAATVGDYLMVAEELNNPTKGNEVVHQTEMFSVAKNFLRRKRTRAAAAAEAELAVETEGLVDDIFSDGEVAVQNGELELDPTANPSTTLDLDKYQIDNQPEIKPILRADFNTWARTPSAKGFNLIHCDFPYGSGLHNQALKGQAAVAQSLLGTYEDTNETYNTLIESLGHALTNGLVADSAHLIFWFPMIKYQETFDKLVAQGWRVQPHPLIWTFSDGFLPDSNRGPRRCYETAFLASHGDRQILQAGPNCIEVQKERAGKVHLSEKPLMTLYHFFTMLVDEHTTLLDPTCGSGNSLSVALRLGAQRVLGLEKDDNYFKAALEQYDRLAFFRKVDDVVL